MAVVDNIVLALNKLGGYAHLSDIYEVYEEITGGVVKSTIRRTLQEHSSDTLTKSRGEDLFYLSEAGTGNWGLRDYQIPHSRTTSDSQESRPAEKRVESIIYRIPRNTKTVQALKEDHNNTCQLCNLRLEIGGGKYYSEGHHVKPLGGIHLGPDSNDNIIILCPNCHVQCDSGALCLSRELVGPRIKQDYIDYHNQNIFIGD